MDQAAITVVSGAVAAVVAAGGVIVTWYLSVRNEKRTLEQIRLNSESIAMEWKRDLRSWASEAIDALSEAICACEEGDISSENSPGGIHTRLRISRVRLSSLVDRGRFFLPNSHTEIYKPDKNYAYRGYRHAALDPLVASIKVIEGSIGTFPSAHVALQEMRREFVSSIHKILGPVDANQKIAQMLQRLDSAGNPDRTLGGLIASPDKVPRGADALLWR